MTLVSLRVRRRGEVRFIISYYSEQQQQGRPSGRGGRSNHGRPNEEARPPATFAATREARQQQQANECKRKRIVVSLFQKETDLPPAARANQAKSSDAESGDGALGVWSEVRAVGVVTARLQLFGGHVVEFVVARVARCGHFRGRRTAVEAGLRAEEALAFEFVPQGR